MSSTQPAGSTTSAPHASPPPAGYPTRDGAELNQSFSQNPDHHFSPEIKSRGDGFWKGCCAALCCCCVLDACF